VNVQLLFHFVSCFVVNRRIGTGGAASNLDVLHFFEDIGVPITEGYGLTETAAGLVVSTPGWKNRKLGSVGVPIVGMEVKVIDSETLNEQPMGTDGEVTDCFLSLSFFYYLLFVILNV
jgi:long-subunit acyl-CoA synthetase (AMP-forming)